MKFPNVSCSIKILTSINRSEDTQKIETAILNIFPHLKIKKDNFSAISFSEDLHILDKIHDNIHSKQLQKIYQRQFEKNLENNSTWFYINKQAALMGTVVLCEEAEESPLGPIKIEINSSSIDRVIDWLII
jgi:uncharacterized protein